MSNTGCGGMISTSSSLIKDLGFEYPWVLPLVRERGGMVNEGLISIYSSL